MGRPSPRSKEHSGQSHLDNGKHLRKITKNVLVNFGYPILFTGRCAAYAEVRCTRAAQVVEIARWRRRRTEGPEADSSAAIVRHARVFITDAVHLYASGCFAPRRNTPIKTGRINPIILNQGEVQSNLPPTGN